MKTKKEKTKIGMLTFIYLAARVVRWNIVLTKKKNKLTLCYPKLVDITQYVLRCKILSQQNFKNKAIPHDKYAQVFQQQGTQL